MLAKKVWSKFRERRVFQAGLVEKKGRYSYLSWTAAIEILNDEFPDNTIEFEMFDHPQGYRTHVMYHPNGTAEVVVKITIREDGEEFSRSMFLPVKDNKHKSIANPSSMAINTAKQRCIVKCLAMMGLGLHVYSGAEDDPEYVMSGSEKLENVCSSIGIDVDTVDAYLKSVSNGRSVHALAEADDGELDSFLTHVKDNTEMIKQTVNNELESQQ